MQLPLKFTILFLACPALLWKLTKLVGSVQHFRQFAPSKLHSLISGVTGPMLVKFLSDIERLLSPVLMRPMALQLSNPTEIPVAWSMKLGYVNFRRYAQKLIGYCRNVSWTIGKRISDWLSTTIMSTILKIWWPPFQGAQVKIKRRVISITRRDRAAGRLGVLNDKAK